MRVVHGYALLAAVMLVSVSSTGWLLFGAPGHDRGRCRLWITGPTRVVACQDGHSYDQFGHDLGPDSPVAAMPRR